MLIRHSTPPAAITQPAHAWVAGQLARAWGSDAFRLPPLSEELAFATDQHDVGYLNWERAPSVDPATGIPHIYKTLPCGQHLEIWRNGIAWMRPVSRFAALIISLHSSGLYQRRFDWENSTESDCQLIQSFLEEQKSLQQELIESLTRSPRYEHLREASVLENYALLVGTWDLISLHVCEAGVVPLELADVPGANGAQPLMIEPVGESKNEWSVAPWPFRERQVILHFDVRPIHPPYSSDQALRADLARVSPETVRVKLLQKS